MSTQESISLVLDSADQVLLTSLKTLFQEHLKDVAFPGVSLEQLEAKEVEIKQHREAAEKLRTELELVLAQEAEGREGLKQLCSRGLAYARVYGEDHEEVGAFLAKLDVTSPRKQKTKRKRTRKGSEASGKLALVEAQEQQDGTSEESVSAQA